MTKTEDETFPEAETYEIQIEGHLDDRWQEWFEGMQIRQEEGGMTTLHGNLPDQTALHSVLLRIRNMNLKIVSVRQIKNTNVEDQTRKEKSE